MPLLRVKRSLVSLLVGLSAILLSGSPPAAAATIRETIASAIAAPTASEQRDIVLSLKSTPSPEAVVWLDKWKEGVIFVHEDADGAVIPVLLTGEPDAEGTFATLRLADDSPLLAPDGNPVRINPKVVDFADTSSGLRRAMKEVADLTALADPDPEKRIRAIQNSSIGQKAEKLPALIELQLIEKDPGARKALDESIALIRLKSADRQERLASCKTLGNLGSIAALDVIKGVLSDAQSANDEQLDMLMVCHHLDSKIPEDVAFAESRIRPETIAAEDRLHDLGAISMMSSDSQAMGRIGETITRTWQTAHKMKVQFGKLDGPSHPAADNFRALRYVSKYTICPAITHGIGHEVGSIEVGKLADLVIWKPAFFGVKPETILKGGFIAWANMGDPNASIPTPQPTFYRPQFGAHAKAIASTSVTFVSAASLESGDLRPLDLKKRLVAVKNCRSVTKTDLPFNDAMPKITVDPDSYTVTADGSELRCEPLSVLPMAQRYFLF
jgi:hypothetical protein